MINYILNKKNTVATAFAALLLSNVGCNPDDKQNIDKQTWLLTWSDEFSGNRGDLPDANKWTYDIGAGGWGNQELQYYTNRPENVSLDGTGNLVITAKSENLGNSSYTSARIKTQGYFSQTYGRFESRIKSTYGPGIWPAFWMLGSNIKTIPWPKCGEIDIMEQKGQLPNVTYGTLHGPGYSAGNAITGNYALKDNRFDNDFHIYAVEWNADKIDFFVDDYLYKRITKNEVSAKGNWVFDHSFFLILNIAVGGNFAGFPTSQTPMPQVMQIDYVRIYEFEK